MPIIDVLLPLSGTCRWQQSLIDRLTGAGYDIRASGTDSASSKGVLLKAILGLERRLPGAPAESLVDGVGISFDESNERDGDLIIDLTGSVEHTKSTTPVLTVRFQGRTDLMRAAESLCRGVVPVIDIYLDGEPVGRAEPMANSRVFIRLGLDQVVARAITLIASYVDRRCRGIEDRPSPDMKPLAADSSKLTMRLARSYLLSCVPRLVARTIGRLRYYPGHWRVGYRLTEGPGVAQTGSLSGGAWKVLPDTGERFYADPFPFEWQGQYFIFVEELVHANGKGVISVSEQYADGSFAVPHKVLEEPFHLSYPQVFARDGEIWMIPEAGSGKKVTLYRAEQFPDRWVEHCVLIPDREIFDATLLDHEGLLWLFAAGRDGAGSGADTMVVYFADRLAGPWQAHPMNPILIDKAAARPGGGFVKLGDRILLPVQDGTECYGGGLGLSELVRLDVEHVEMSKPVPIDTQGHWPYPRIHTLNRHGRLETIDGIVTMARFKKPKL